MQVIAPVMVLFSVLFPGKLWYSPDQPLTVQVRGAGSEVTLVLVDFLGKTIESDTTVTVADGASVDLRQRWPQLRSVGTYLLLAVPPGKAPRDFIGTPVLISVRGDKRRDAPPGPMVIKVEPLRYGLISTDQGDMTVAFYYDVAPHTVANFEQLADGGFYDGLTFHRIAPDFILQGGDPKGDGTGGPGYTIDAEFNSREHQEGVLSMARQGDPLERQGSLPRPEAANSAGSQFFICLKYDRTKQLDGRYTAFGRIVDGLDVVHALAKVPLEPESERPINPPQIKSVRILPVTSERNPYASLLNLSAVPTSQPTTAP